MNPHAHRGSIAWRAVAVKAEAGIVRAAPHLSFAGAPLGNGREKSRDALAQSPALQSTMRQAIAASGPVRPGRREAAA
jgi:glycerate kinase